MPSQGNRNADLHGYFAHESLRGDRRERPRYRGAAAPDSALQKVFEFGSEPGNSIGEITSSQLGAAYVPLQRVVEAETAPVVVGGRGIVARVH
jgi:hypothetical protein